MLYLLVSIGFIAAVALAANYFSKAGKLSAELARKLVHMSLGSSIFVTSLSSNKTWTAALISISLGAVVIAKESGLFESFRKVGRSTNGDMFYLIGALAALVLAGSQAAFGIAILVLTFADAMAALVGKAVGNHKVHVLGEAKSLEGSLAFAVVTAVIASLFVVVGPELVKGNYLLIAVLPAVLTPLEALSPKGIDNLTLPVVAVLAVNLLS